MKYMVKGEVFHETPGFPPPIEMLEAFKSYFEWAKSTGKVLYEGAFPDQRGGFMVLNVDTPEELNELLGFVAGTCTLELHPLNDWADLPKLFQKMEKH